MSHARNTRTVSARERSAGYGKRVASSGSSRSVTSSASTSLALDAADGVIDGKFYGRRIAGSPTRRTALSVDAADGVIDGKYFGRKIISTTSRPQSASSAALALDAADGVIDGKYYNRRIITTDSLSGSMPGTPATPASLALDAADGVIDGKYYGRRIIPTRKTSHTSYVPSSTLALDAADGVIDGTYYGSPLGTRVASSYISRNGSALALDAADGVIDGKFYGRDIVTTTRRASLGDSYHTSDGEVAVLERTLEKLIRERDTLKHELRFKGAANAEEMQLERQLHSLEADLNRQRHQHDAEKKNWNRIPPLTVLDQTTVKELESLMILQQELLREKDVEIRNLTKLCGVQTEQIHYLAAFLSDGLQELDSILGVRRQEVLAALVKTGSNSAALTNAGGAFTAIERRIMEKSIHHEKQFFKGEMLEVPKEEHDKVRRINALRSMKDTVQGIVPQSTSSNGHSRVTSLPTRKKSR